MQKTWVETPDSRRRDGLAYLAGAAALFVTALLARRWGCDTDGDAPGVLAAILCVPTAAWGVRQLVTARRWRRRVETARLLAQREGRDWQIARLVEMIGQD